MQNETRHDFLKSHPFTQEDRTGISVIMTYQNGGSW
jgi:hypothetical protein